MSTLIVILLIVVFALGYATGRNMQIVAYEEKIKHLRYEIEYLNDNYVPIVPKPKEISKEDSE